MKTLKSKKSSKKAAKKTYKKGSKPRHGVTFQYCEQHDLYFPRGAKCPWCAA